MQAEEVAYIIWAVFNTCLIGALIFFMIFVSLALMLALYKRAFYEIVYFFITIILTVLRVISRFVEVIIQLIELNSGRSKSISQIRFVEYLIIVILDFFISFVLISGFLVITHKWFVTFIRFTMNVKSKIMGSIPSFAVYIFFITVQIASLIIVILLLVFLYESQQFNIIGAVNIVYYASHAFLFFMVGIIFLVVGLSMSRLLRKLHNVAENDTGPFVRGAMQKTGNLSKKVFWISLPISLFYFFGSFIMVFRIFCEIIAVVALNSDHMPVNLPYVDIFVENEVPIRIFLLILYYIPYIFIFEIGISGFITVYYLARPDDAISSLPTIKEVRHFEMLFYDEGGMKMDEDIAPEVDLLEKI